MRHEALHMIEYGDEPPVLVFSDAEEGRQRLSAIAEGLGCRIGAAGPIAGSVARLDQQVALAGVLVVAERDPGPEFDRLLDRLDAGARAGRFGSVVATAPGLIDTVWARASHPAVRQLSRPSEAELIAATAAAVEQRPLRLHEGSKNKAPSRLRQMSEEIARISALLSAIAEEQSGMDLVLPARGGAEEAEVTPALIRAIIRARRLRDQYFRGDLFADPAWDMMLDLMVARLERRQVAVSSLCIAASVPSTTALRWIKGLTDGGLFVRVADPQDGRRVYIELADDAAAALADYLKAVQRLSPLAI